MVKKVLIVDFHKIIIHKGGCGYGIIWIGEKRGEKTF